MNFPQFCYWIVISKFSWIINYSFKPQNFIFFLLSHYCFCSIVAQPTADQVNAQPIQGNALGVLFKHLIQYLRCQIAGGKSLTIWPFGRYDKYWMHRKAQFSMYVSEMFNWNEKRMTILQVRYSYLFVFKLIHTVPYFVTPQYITGSEIVHWLNFRFPSTWGIMALRIFVFTLHHSVLVAVFKGMSENKGNP